MKRIMTIGRDLSIINSILEQEGLLLVSTEPDLIVTHGGDGYLLQAEREYPGVPKLPIRRNSICKTCVDHDTTHIVKALARGTISKSRVMKLECTIEGKTYYALNEFSFHHVMLNQAIRFDVKINDEDHVETAIGDGLVVSTPFGSHAYYRSITRSIFRQGIGLAFNNTTEAIDHLVIRDTDTVSVKLLRGPACFMSDNDPIQITLEKDAVATISKSSKVAQMLGLEYSHCPDCGVLESTVAEA